MDLLVIFFAIWVVVGLTAIPATRWLGTDDWRGSIPPIGLIAGVVFWPFTFVFAGLKWLFTAEV